MKENEDLRYEGRDQAINAHLCGRAMLQMRPPRNNKLWITYACNKAISFAIYLSIDQSRISDITQLVDIGLKHCQRHYGPRR